MELVNEYGPQFSESQFVTVLKVLDFTSQVWINCEDQVNMFQNPCGQLFSKMASNIRINLKAKQFQFPCSLISTLGLQFGHFIRDKSHMKIASILCVLFLKWSQYIETKSRSSNATVDLKLLLEGLSQGLMHVEEIQANPSHFVRTLKSGHSQIEKLKCNSSAEDVLQCLECAADAAETYANTHLVNGIKAAEAHLVGITLRAIYQAFKITL